jgi:hypothetical protein
MAGHSRPKDGVALALAYVPAIHVLLPAAKTWMPGASPGMTGFKITASSADLKGRATYRQRSSPLKRLNARRKS